MTKQKQPIDSLFARVFIFMLGLALLGISLLPYIASNPTEWWALLLIMSLSVFGVLLVAVSIVSSEETAVTVAEKTGNHEALVLFVLMAGALSNLIRKLKSAP